MPDWYYLWVEIFAIQGIMADILLVFGGMFILYLWVSYLINLQKVKERQQLRESVETQMNRLLRDIEGL